MIIICNNLLSLVMNADKARNEMVDEFKQKVKLWNDQIMEEFSKKVNAMNSTIQETLQETVNNLEKEIKNSHCIHRNDHIRSLIGTRSMTVPGWTMDIDTGSPTPEKEDKYRKMDEWDMHKCFHPYTWWGENIGSYNGFIKTSLKRCGRARLNFGNCYIDENKKKHQHKHYVQVKLNNVEIGQADAGISNKTIEFDFKDGDILELQDIAEATIKFNDFVIISCVKC